MTTLTMNAAATPTHIRVIITVMILRLVVSLCRDVHDDRDDRPRAGVDREDPVGRPVRDAVDGEGRAAAPVLPRERRGDPPQVELRGEAGRVAEGRGHDAAVLVADDQVDPGGLLDHFARSGRRPPGRPAWRRSSPLDAGGLVRRDGAQEHAGRSVVMIPWERWPLSPWRTIGCRSRSLSIRPRWSRRRISLPSRSKMATRSTRERVFIGMISWRRRARSRRLRALLDGGEVDLQLAEGEQLVEFPADDVADHAGDGVDLAVDPFLDQAVGGGDAVRQGHAHPGHDDQREGDEDAEEDPAAEGLEEPEDDPARSDRIRERLEVPGHAGGSRQCIGTKPLSAMIFRPSGPTR